MKWKKKIERARRLHRPKLVNWERDGLYKEFPTFVESLSSPQHNYESLLLAGAPHPPSLPLVLDAHTLDPNFFASTLEAKGIPCVIRNVPHAEGWEAPRAWTMEELETNDAFRNRYFKCGESDSGKSIKVKMKHFIQYVYSNRDDSPLYIFDSAFDDDRKANKILSDYKVPLYFRNDLFGLLSENRRPPYRWFLVGPERSGTTVHMDPLATSAWNTLIVGKKRWVLFPPNVPKDIAKGKHFVRKGEDDEAIHYFITLLPRIKAKALEIGNRGMFKDFACYEFTQEAGETVFIPNGWWHAVLNLTHTIGITQNYCSERNFEHVWIETRRGRKLMAAKWMNQLDIHYPHLAEKARMFNRRDNFVMRHDPEAVKRHDEAKIARLKNAKTSSKRSSPDTQSSVTSDSSSEQHRASPRYVTSDNPSLVRSSLNKIEDPRTVTTCDESDVMSGEYHY